MPTGNISKLYYYFVYLQMALDNPTIDSYDKYLH